MKLMTDNDTELDSEGGWARPLTEHAQQKGLSDLVVFYAKCPDGYEAYVVYDKSGDAVYASQSFESVSIWLDLARYSGEYNALGAGKR